MSVRRLVIFGAPLAEGRRVLPDEAAHYVTHVLRLGVGRALVLRDGQGSEADAVVVAAGRRVELELEAPRRLPEPPGPAITLIQALGKGDKLDVVVRMATELGVARIRPVASARAIPEHAGRRARWIAIAEDATRVSGRARLPEIDPPRPLAEVLAGPHPSAIVLAGAAARPLSAALAALADPRALELLVGPEGGLDEAELALAESAGFAAAHLGPRVLRTETAGPTAVALAMFALGGLG